MRVTPIAIGHRTATFEITNGFPAIAPWQHTIHLDGRPVLSTRRNVFTLHDLPPGAEFELDVISKDYREHLSFHTKPAAYRIDVREFGATPDGKRDNTAALQAAISTSPANTVLEFSSGDWLTAPLFLRDKLHLHFAAGARLLGHADVQRWPVLPATIGGDSGQPSQVLGSWEGVADDMHAGLITGVNVTDVSISGQGCIDANASFDNWWSRPKDRFVGRRPRTIYLVDSQRVSIVGVTLLNAPSWTIHALRCLDLGLLDLRIEAPEKSPNTDGINPESCARVRIAGARISTGDDCIAIKSGKLSDTPRALQPCRDIAISNCILRNGHAAVALGSEMSGGIHDVDISDCIFENAPRGLRIKTRRGRGAAAIVRGVRLNNVRMQDVGTPFVINCFYDCDADAKTEYVADRNPRPVDGGTPSVLDISITNVTAERTKHCAAFVLGLPEQPVGTIEIERYHVTMDPLAQTGFPDQAAGIQAVARAGYHFCNVRSLAMSDYSVEGELGPKLTLQNIEQLVLDTPRPQDGCSCSGSQVLAINE